MIRMQAYTLIPVTVESAMAGKNSTIAMRPNWYSTNETLAYIRTGRLKRASKYS